MIPLAAPKKEPTTHARIRKRTCAMLDIIAAANDSDIPSLIDELFLEQIEKHYRSALIKLQQVLKPEKK